MDIIDIKNLTFRYKNNFIFDNFNLKIEAASWVTIAGANGSGKSTLTKLLAGLDKSYSSITIFNKVLNKKNINKIRKDVGFVFDVPENFFVCETVEDELAFSLENMAIMPDCIRKKIDEVSKILNIKDILNKNPYDLSGGQKQKVALACALMLEPRILILDEALSMLDINEKEEVLKVLKYYNQNKRVTILLFTHNLEESIYSNRLVVLNNGKIIIDGSVPLVFNEENIMRKVGLEVPFAIELSQKLRVYGLVDKVELNLERLVSKLWK